MQDEIRRALIEVHSDDLPMIRSYVRWVRIRRKVTDRFYFKAHWIAAPVRRFHWVG